MTDIEAYDENGNRLYPVTICTICPIAEDATGRELCFSYWQACEDYTGHTVESMLPDILGPIGADGESHIYCARTGYTHQQNRIIGYMSAMSTIYPMVHSRFATLNDDPDLIKSKLCVFIGDSADLLSHLGLEVKRTRA